MTRPVARAAITAAALGAAPLASAQSLFERPVTAADAGYTAAPADSLQGYSLMLVLPPEPREYKVHALITIIVEESARATTSESLETDKSSELDGSVNAMIDPLELLELRLRQGDLSNEALINTEFSNEFDGEGDYERTDRLSTRVTAEIIDIKPNGTLVLQARKRIEQNGESQEYVLSGLCRQEDVSTANTILSTQVADLAVSITNDGEVRSAASKGWITRLFEGVFDF
ncbi:MAG: flagellar basal body L-ring protein FlgH [Thermomicrobiales bacterium]|nr:flagellar basal body L-ring protein FlgH [Thermomicrobiales bacterium]